MVVHEGWVGTIIVRMIGVLPMDFVAEELQAERMIRNRRKGMSLRMLFRRGQRLYFLIACWSCWKEVIQAMVLTKSAREALCARKARTAGPTGSSPAAPPGISAYAP